MIPPSVFAIPRGCNIANQFFFSAINRYSGGVMKSARIAALVAFVLTLSIPSLSSPIAPLNSRSVAASRTSPEQAPLDSPPANYKPAVLYSTGGTVALQIAVADVNGDGKPDMIVADGCADSNCATGSVGVLLGNGDGTFETAVVYPTGGAGAVAVSVADVNHDTKPDLVVANGCVTNTDCTDGTLSVLLGNGDGTFQSALSYSTGGQVYGMGLGDMNGDGRLDAIVGTFNGVGTLFGNQDGGFQPALISATGGFGSLAVGDLNGDGIPDAVTILSRGGFGTQRINGSIGVMLGHADGSFTPPFSLDALGFSPDGLAIVDVNNNHAPDILVSDNLGHVNQTAGSVALWYGNGDGTFDIGVPVRIGGTGAHAVAAADVNGDGQPDIVVSENGNVSVVLTGGATHHHTVGAGKSIVIADVSGDGQPDIVVALNCSGNCTDGGAAVLISKADPTTTTVATSGSPSQLGQPVTFTATITSTRGPIANGRTITFFDGTTKIGTGTTAQGVATFTTSSLTAGTHTIKAKFPGYPFFKPSSGTVKQVVNP
jgi:hypothetical protein